MKKLFSVLLTVAMTTTILAACSSNNNNSANSASSSPAAEGTAAPASTSDPAAKKIEITAMDYSFSDPAPLDGKALQMINEKFNVDYKPQLVPYADYAAKMSATVAGGDTPDIMMIEDPAQGFKTWAQQGAFLDVTQYIDKYPTFKNVPADVWDAMRVDGKIVGIPRYYPSTYNSHIILRQDWLDNLGLKMPTTLDELKQVAIAFTKNDPDKNGKNDTYGLVMSSGFWPNYTPSAYWDASSWYHKDDQGNLIPGIVAPARKEMIGWLRDLYKEGAITKDFPVITNVVDSAKDFWSGKAGIYTGTARGMGDDGMKILAAAVPTAKLAPLPPFLAPDGSQGLTALGGYYGLATLNAKLVDDPDKVDRIMQMLDYGRKFTPLEERNSSSPDFDWMYGGEGTGYTLENGVVAITPSTDGLMPWWYMPDRAMWPAKDSDNQYSKTYTTPQMQDLISQIETLDAQYEHYVNPFNRIFSQTYTKKGFDIEQKMYAQEAKIVVGETPLEDWDKIKDAYLSSGGNDIIKEVNEQLKGTETTVWKKQ